MSLLNVLNCLDGFCKATYCSKFQGCHHQGKPSGDTKNVRGGGGGREFLICQTFDDILRNM